MNSIRSVLLAMSLVSGITGFAPAQNCDEIVGYPLGTWLGNCVGVGFGTICSLTFDTPTSGTWIYGTFTSSAPPMPDAICVVEMSGESFGTPIFMIQTCAVDAEACYMTSVWTAQLGDLFFEGAGALVWYPSGSPTEPDYIRGDCSNDGAVDIADAIRLLGILHIPGTLPSFCKRACEANDDGNLDLGDVIYILSYLYTGGPAFPEPFLACGQDPTPTGPVYPCVSYWSCP